MHTGMQLFADLGISAVHASHLLMQALQTTAWWLQLTSWQFATMTDLSWKATIAAPSRGMCLLDSACVPCDRVSTIVYFRTHAQLDQNILHTHGTCVWHLS